ncbi:hypothetical protein LTR60_003589, partial [Cryomyces antarcticus]
KLGSIRYEELGIKGTTEGADAYDDTGQPISYSRIRLSASSPRICMQTSSVASFSFAERMCSCWERLYVLLSNLVFSHWKRVVLRSIRTTQDLDKDDYIPEPYREAPVEQVFSLQRKESAERKKKDKVRQGKLAKMGFEVEQFGEAIL